MIIAKKPAARQKVFEAVRTTVQEIHPGVTFENDSCGFPFLFKSTDAKVWGRVFYQPMVDSSSEELTRELIKLKVLMPEDALMYLFYPSLDQGKMFKFRSVGDRLAFFEYGALIEDQAEKAMIEVRKWVPASAVAQAAVRVRAPLAGKDGAVSFLDYTRLSTGELTELTELGLSLKRV